MVEYFGILVQYHFPVDMCEIVQGTCHIRMTLTKISLSNIKYLFIKCFSFRILALVGIELSKEI